MKSGNRKPKNEFWIDKFYHIPMRNVFINWWPKSPSDGGWKDQQPADIRIIKELFILAIIKSKCVYSVFIWINILL